MGRDDGKQRIAKTTINQVSVGTGPWKLTVAMETNFTVAEFRSVPEGVPRC